MVSFELTGVQTELINDLRKLAPMMEERALHLDEAGDDRFDFFLGGRPRTTFFHNFALSEK